MAEENGTVGAVGGGEGEDGGGGSMEPMVGGGAVGVGAKPIKAEDGGVGGKEMAACWVSVCVIEEGGETGRGGGGGDGGVGKEEGEGVVDGVEGSMSRSGLRWRNGMLAWRVAGKVPKLQLMEIQAGEECEERSWVEEVEMGSVWRHLGLLGRWETGMDASLGVVSGFGVWVWVSGGWEGHFVACWGKREGSKAVGLAAWAWVRVEARKDSHWTVCELALAERRESMQRPRLRGSTSIVIAALQWTVVQV